MSMDNEFVIRRIGEAADTFIGGVIGGAVAGYVIRDFGPGVVGLFGIMSVTLLFGGFIIMGWLLNAMRDIFLKDEKKPSPRIRHESNRNTPRMR